MLTADELRSQADGLLSQDYHADRAFSYMSQGGGAQYSQPY